MPRRIVSAREQAEMLSPWRKTADRIDFRWERDSGGNWILIARNPDGNPVSIGTSPAPNVRSGSKRIASELPLFLNEHGEPIGININDGKQDFTGQILRGEKSVETRDSNSLKKYIGKRIGLIRTGLGKAHVVGYATLGEPKLYDNRDDFNADYDLHQVDEDSDYHFDRAKHGVKFGYPLHDVEHEPDPYPVDSLGHRYRPIPRNAGLTPDEEQRMRDTYASYDPANPPESLRPHLMLPTEIAHHYREHDRPLDEGLSRVIADQGIRQPLRISTDGTQATLHEGNHRLEVARQLGISHVPVQVTLEKPGDVVNNGGRPPVGLEPLLGNWIQENGHRLRSFWE